MILRLACTLAIALLAAPPEALAWGQTGHRVTGAIAERHLSDEARAAVRLILGPETLAEASTWADFMRASPEPFWQEAAGPWHYVTVPPGSTHAEVGAPPEGDAVTALARFEKTLRDETAPLAERQLALRFAIHIIGDLHQPLHVGNGNNRGGNDIRVRYHREPTNLHSVWDSGMIDRQQLSYSEMTDWLDARITPEQLQAWSDTDPQTWLRESAEIRDRIYPQGDEIGYDYDFAHLATLQRRLQQGGVRIAVYLNALFAEF